MTTVERPPASTDTLLIELADALRRVRQGDFRVRLARRTGLLEIKIFVLAMLIQQQAGGNLSEMLERLAGLVRDRLRLRRQVRTLTAEGRLQGLTLLVLPVLVFAALLVINRKYAEVLLQHPSLIAATLTAMGVGVLWIRRIVNFDV